MPLGVPEDGLQSALAQGVDGVPRGGVEAVVGVVRPGAVLSVGQPAVSAAESEGGRAELVVDVGAVFVKQVQDKSVFLLSHRAVPTGRGWVSQW